MRNFFLFIKGIFWRIFAFMDEKINFKFCVSVFLNFYFLYLIFWLCEEYEKKISIYEKSPMVTKKIAETASRISDIPALTLTEVVCNLIQWTGIGCIVAFFAIIIIRYIQKR